jgi:hypothetical protein
LVRKCQHGVGSLSKQRENSPVEDAMMAKK